MTIDPVQKPAHYNAGKYETIDIIEDSLTPEEFAGYCKGNALKYIIRADKKHRDKPTEDLEKAVWYLNRLVRAFKLHLNGCTDTPMQQDMSYHHWDERAPHGAKINRVVPRSGPHFL